MNSTFPAYPLTGVSTGLTKRELFAMSAMQSLILAESDMENGELAKTAVMLADSLLAALESSKP